MSGEPVEGEPLHFLERTRFLEQMRGMWNDRELHRRAHAPHRGFVHLDHGTIVPADNQQGRRPDEWKRIARQVGPATARHNSGCVRPFRRCNQRRRRPSARAEISDWQIPEDRVRARPVCGGNDSTAEQRDIESILGRADIDALFRLRQQVE
jgi:hypothetical protein